MKRFLREQVAHRVETLTDALASFDSSPESLHDLRVAIRRVQQCQRLFGGHSSLKRQIQAQRAEAGEVLTTYLDHKYIHPRVTNKKHFRPRDIPRKIAKWFAAGNATAQDGSQALHRFRLLGKRLRYTLELFPGTETLVQQLRMVQDHLGAIQDCVAALPLIDGHPRATAAVTKLQSSRERAFRKSWKTLAKKADQWKSTFSATAKPKTAPSGAATLTAS